MLYYVRHLEPIDLEKTTSVLGSGGYIPLGDPQLFRFNGISLVLHDVTIINSDNV